MKKARIVFIITKLELGGAQQHVLYTASHLDRDIFEPIIIFGEPDILDDEARSLGLECRQVHDMVREIRPRKDISALRAVTRILREIKRREPELPVLVHTHSSKAGILGRWAAFFARCDVVIHTYHGFGFTDRQHPLVRNAFIVAERVTRPITDAFTCVSRANIEKGRKTRVLRTEDTALVRSGIDISEFNPEGRDIVAIKRSIGVPFEAPLVGMVACFKPQKSPVDFVDAAGLVLKNVPDAHFMVAGDGELRGDMETRIEQLGLGERMHLLGWRHDVPDLLAAMDVLALTSLFEGLPRVLPQAMAAGKPAVATAVDGSPEAVSDAKTGFLVEPREIENIAEKITLLLKDAEMRRRMGEEGMKLVGEFDQDKMVADHQAQYLEMLKRKVDNF